MNRRMMLILLACGLSHLARAHGDVELGPNKGRILEFTKDESLVGELTLKEKTFRVGLFDKDAKPVAITGQTLAVITGDRDKPVDLKVEVKDNLFVFPQNQETKHHLIFRFRPTADGLPVTTRVLYDPSNGSGCNKPEWVCACH